MEYLKVWVSFRKDMEELQDAEKGRLFDAMLLYAETGEESELKGAERILWPSAKNAIDRTAAKNKKLKSNGEKGGRPTITNENQTKAKITKLNQTEATETNENQTKAYIKKYKNNTTPSIVSPFLTDEEAAAIQADHDEILDMMQTIGLQASSWNMKAILDLYGECGKEAVLYGLKEAARLNKVSVAYIETCIRNYGKPKPDEEHQTMTAEETEALWSSIV